MGNPRQSDEELIWKGSVCLPGVREFLKNHNAVSEVMGEVLMTSIVVIIMSGVAVSVFAIKGPDDVPKTDVEEWVNLTSDVLYLKNTGGDVIDADKLEISMNINGIRHIYTSHDISASLKKSTWDVGEVIEINASKEWGINLNEKDSVDVFLIDIPSKKLIQKHSISLIDESSGWSTPSKLVDTSGGLSELIQVQRLGDGLKTTYKLPARNPSESLETQLSTSGKYQEVEFDVTSSSNMLLKVVYSLPDENGSYDVIKLYIQDASSSKWAEGLDTDSGEHVAEYNITSIAGNCLKVRFVAIGNTSGKIINVDYIAIK